MAVVEPVSVLTGSGFRFRTGFGRPIGHKKVTCHSRRGFGVFSSRTKVTLALFTVVVLGCFPVEQKVTFGFFVVLLECSPVEK